MSRTTILPLSRGGPTLSDGRRSSYFPPQSDDAPEDKRIAVIAMECRMPGGMNTSAEFWEGLQLGTDAMVDIPLSRFDTDMVYDSYDNATRGTSYVRRGGFLDRAEYFDLARFNIPAAQLEQMDPQQRILLEVVDEALQQAGYDHQDVQGTDVSVYIGVSSKDWAKVAPRDGAYLGTGIAGSIVSNRISFELGLTGTSMSIDTACSSSLVAVDLAVQALRQGATDMAIAGGINLNLHPDPYVVLCGSRMLSPDGTCKTLDADADGYARSEGCGVVLLKRLPDALRDGDPIVGVLTGSYSNQDGRSTNISAPNGKAQQQLVRRALEDAGRIPDDVDYVEMHGTGTSLGDPVEVHALKGVFGMARSANNSLNKDSKGLGRSQRQLPLWLGAVKSNVGHLEPAAGMAGLIKTLWVVKERQVPPNIHMNKINPGIDFTGFEMSRIPQRPERIQKEAGDVVVAGCSSFGFGGTNVHVVVESPPP
ncbi:beta-ketoacyl synthase, partial [Diaporthe sp. PMI_573]